MKQSDVYWWDEGWDDCVAGHGEDFAIDKAATDVPAEHKADYLAGWDAGWNAAYDDLGDEC